MDKKDKNMGKSNRFRNLCISLRLPYTESCYSNEFIEKVPYLVDIAEQEILMSTDLHPKFYNAEDVKNAFENAVERGVNIEILVDTDGFDISEIRWLRSYLDERRIRVFRSREKVRHIMVVDKKHVREETLHERNKYGGAENDIMYHAGVIATLNRKTIKAWIEESEPVT